MESVFYFLSGILSILYFVHIPWFLSHFCSYRKMHTWKQHFFAFLLLCFFMFFPVNQISYTETSSLLWVISFLFQILFYFFSFFITAYFIYKNTLFLSIVAVTLLFFSVLRLYRRIWKYASLPEFIFTVSLFVFISFRINVKWVVPAFHVGKFWNSFLMADFFAINCICVGKIPYNEAYRSRRITRCKQFEKKDYPEKGKWDEFY